MPHETAPGEFDRTTGFGDITLVELLSPAHTGHWILGAGPTFIFPTATSDFTGQGKWQAGPALVVGHLTKDFIVGVFPQQWWSFAGDSNRPDTSQMNLQPFAAWFFGEGWKVGYSGNILADWKAPSNNRWTVPIGGELGKVMKLGRVSLSIAIAVRYQLAIRPDNVGQKWNFRTRVDAGPSEAHQGAAVQVMPLRMIMHIERRMRSRDSRGDWNADASDDHGSVGATGLSGRWRLPARRVSSAERLPDSWIRPVR